MMKSSPGSHENPPQSPEAVKKLGAVDRAEGCLQNCRMRAFEMCGS